MSFYCCLQGEFKSFEVIFLKAHKVLNPLTTVCCILAQSAVICTNMQHSGKGKLFLYYSYSLVQEVTAHSYTMKSIITMFSSGIFSRMFLSLQGEEELIILMSLMILSQYCLQKDACKNGIKMQSIGPIYRKYKSKPMIQFVHFHLQLDK